LKLLKYLAVSFHLVKVVHNARVIGGMFSLPEDALIGGFKVEKVEITVIEL